MLVWKDSLSTGHPEIDEEHREIYRRMNDLGHAIKCGADETTLTNLVEVLLEYAHEHFRHEEHVMECARCTHRKANCEAHRLFVERLNIWLNLANSTRLPRSMILDLHEETTHWIEQHIGRIDVHLRDPAPAEKPLEVAN